MLEIGSRRIFNEDHDAFRETCRKFYAEHIVPHSGPGGAWETQQHISREAWLKVCAPQPHLEPKTRPLGLEHACEEFYLCVCLAVVTPCVYGDRRRWC